MNNSAQGNISLEQEKRLVQWNWRRKTVLVCFIRLWIIVVQKTHAEILILKIRNVGGGHVLIWGGGGQSMIAVWGDHLNSNCLMCWSWGGVNQWSLFEAIAVRWWGDCLNSNHLMCWSCGGSIDDHCLRWSLSGIEAIASTTITSCVDPGGSWSLSGTEAITSTAIASCVDPGGSINNCCWDDRCLRQLLSGNEAIASTAIASCVDPGGESIDNCCLRWLLSGIEAIASTAIASCVDPGGGVDWQSLLRWLLSERPTQNCIVGVLWCIMGNPFSSLRYTVFALPLWNLGYIARKSKRTG